jgi:hypothetical protein
VAPRSMRHASTLSDSLYESEATEIEQAVAQVGWSWPVVARACRCGDTLLAVFGSGDYRLYATARDRWGSPGSRPGSGGDPGSRPSAS